ncbi:hypothetical protein ASPWEDRAFT_186519 [Aspergillus wentii DTO 134E9]|uniref:Thioesterase domain-containing protein n=1 Tax=Aspergillus wentii DTO 134E9 TaxID=1073089 RepID=A0A1L9RBN6_ASPWE|nr:uncharacterized protein ASPWEDRAFT_186519 [Aspergillus wentii DTO 134E9]KAI9934895.1 hypothetical protein MW887_000516 [Aspergillus wentii]OJJ32336.1 hypothetical protein ASPWEDRAFT_186519 [Aspergillus wentii DTO 134E9]
MEPARGLLARRLPRLLYVGGTYEPCVVSFERLSASYMYLWPEFIQDITAAHHLLGLDGQVSLTDSSGGEIIIGNKLGLAVRFIHNTCDAVTKALSVTALQLRFVDAQDIDFNKPVFPSCVLTIRANADESSGVTDQGQVLAVGKLKPWWAVNLENYCHLLTAAPP